MADIKETREMLGFVLALGNAAGKSLEDGRIGLGDLMHIVGALRTAGPAFEGIAQIPSELADLSEDEKAQLKSYITAEFDIPQDSLESAIEAGLKVAVELVDLVMRFFKKA